VHIRNVHACSSDTSRAGVHCKRRMRTPRLRSLCAAGASVKYALHVRGAGEAR